MSAALELVYQYRLLAGKCERGRGLTIEEIDLLHGIEALFGRRGPQCRRGLGREPVGLPATMRVRGRADTVWVEDISPSGLVCRRAPYVDEGTTVELIVEDTECALSYRFKATVTRLDDDSHDDFTLGLRFVGVPLLVRYPGSHRTIVSLASAA